MFNKADYWSRRKEGKRGQGDDKLVDKVLVVPQLVHIIGIDKSMRKVTRKQFRQHKNNPKYTKKLLKRSK